jgi:hypothetical protein
MILKSRQGTLTERERLGTVDLLIKVACFVRIKISIERADLI